MQLRPDGARHPAGRVLGRQVGRLDRHERGANDRPAEDEVLRVKEKKLNFDKVDGDDVVQVAIECYYEDLVNYVFGIFKDRFKKNRGSIDHPIEIILSGGTASPPGFDKRVKAIISKMDLPFEVKEVRLAKDMLRTVATGCFVRAKQAAKKAMKD